MDENDFELLSKKLETTCSNHSPQFQVFIIRSKWYQAHDPNLLSDAHKADEYLNCCLTSSLDVLPTPGKPPTWIRASHVKGTQ